MIGNSTIDIEFIYILLTKNTRKIDGFSKEKDDNMKVYNNNEILKEIYLEKVNSVLII